MELNQTLLDIYKKNILSFNSTLLEAAPFNRTVFYYDFETIVTQRWKRTLTLKPALYAIPAA
jgi:hypothetical protein